MVRSSLEPAGYTNYRTGLTLYVLPCLGHAQLVALTPLTLSSLYVDLLRAGGWGGRPLHRLLADGCVGWQPPATVASFRPVAVRVPGRAARQPSRRGTGSGGVPGIA
ncbi:MAG: hypothetical protein H0V67_07525 [Geodermatophilaceae bacterium]|nr:hypothetical protein [Geodermatophilaceae bacterium]